MKILFPINLFPASSGAGWSPDDLVVAGPVRALNINQEDIFFAIILTPGRGGEDELTPVVKMGERYLLPHKLRVLTHPEFGQVLEVEVYLED